jgi:aryl-alcohol dehydrogenase-like predicted oxidoreductase
MSGLRRVAFGRQGTPVSRLGFGAWGLGGQSYGPVERSEAFAALEAYVAAGGDFIDTARGYGESEALIGEFIRTHGLQGRLFLCSKTGASTANEIRAQAERSRELLGVEAIDLHYLHWPPDDPAEQERVLAVFAELKQAGCIRAIGASIKGPNVSAATQALCRHYLADQRIDALQIIYSLLRPDNDSIFAAARQAGVSLVGRTCLENGFLSGAYAPGHRFAAGDHRARWPAERLDAILHAVDELAALPQRALFPGLAAMALRFAYDEPGLDTLIVGARHAGHLHQTLAALALVLPDDWRTVLTQRQRGTGLGNLA